VSVSSTRKSATWAEDRHRRRLPSGNTSASTQSTTPASVFGSLSRSATTAPPSEPRSSAVGGFAGPVAPDAPIGTYGGRSAPASPGRRQLRRRSRPAATRLVRGHRPRCDRHLQARRRTRADHRTPRSPAAARRAALDDDTVDRAAGELHRAHAILLVDLRRSPQAKRTPGSRNSRAPPKRVRPPRATLDPRARASSGPAPRLLSEPSTRT
jgi:hypothetical protein